MTSELSKLMSDLMEAARNHKIADGRAARARDVESRARQERAAAQDAAEAARAKYWEALRAVGQFTERSVGDL